MILIGRASVQVHSWKKGIRQAAVVFRVRICKVRPSFQLVPVNIISERSIRSRIAHSIHSRLAVIILGEARLQRGY